jgi:hypothetical protein
VTAQIARIEIVDTRDVEHALVERAHGLGLRGRENALLLGASTSCGSWMSLGVILLTTSAAR